MTEEKERKRAKVNENQQMDKKKAKKAAHALNQRAHVKRRQEKTKELEEQVQLLEVSNARLEGQLVVMRLCPPTMNAKRTERVIQEYVQMFRFGYQKHHPKQIPFIHTIMREDVRAHGVVGINYFLEGFRRYCSVDLNFEMTFLSCACIANDDNDRYLVESCVLHVIVSQRLSRSLLALYFPDVLHNENLVQKLIGKRMHIHTTSLFQFDHVGKIVDYSATMELVRAFVSLVQDLELAAMIVEGNRLHPRHYLSTLRA